MNKASDNKKYSLKLFGSFELLSPKGDEIVISSKKGRALLALIISSENAECSRTWLESILWSRGSGSDSLRKELSSVRRKIKEHGEDIFLSSQPKDQIRVNVDLLDIDVISKLHFHEGEFLQGLGIPNESGFKEWLQTKRAYYSNYRDRFTAGDLKNHELHVNFLDDNPVTPRITIGVLPIQSTLNVTNKGNRKGQLNDLMDRVCKLLLNSGSIDIFDYRTQSINKNIISVSQPESIKYELTLHVSENPSTLTLNMRLNQADNKQVLLLDRFQIDYENLSAKDSEKLNEYVFSIVDQIIYTLSKKKNLEFPEQSCPLGLTMDAISSMFRFTEEGIDFAENNLDLAVELSRDSSIFGWRALFATQKLDDPRATNVKAIEEEALYFARRALELDRYNPLTLSLVAHVYSYMFKDFKIAQQYISKAQSLGSDHIMTYDAHSLLNIYTGDYDKAKKSASRASALGRLLPFRHLYLTSLCMIESLTGNHQQAILIGEEALNTQSNIESGIYPPTARYLAANYATVGKFDKAQNLIQHLPDYGSAASFLETTDRTNTNMNIARFLSTTHNVFG